MIPLGTAAGGLQHAWQSARLNRTPSSAWHQALLTSNVHGLVFRSLGVHTTTGTGDPGSWIPLTGLDVPSLLQHLFEALPEVGVQEPSDRRFIQTFPADPHLTFGTAESIRPPAQLTDPARLLSFPILYLFAFICCINFLVICFICQVPFHNISDVQFMVPKPLKQS